MSTVKINLDGGDIGVIFLDDEGVSVLDNRYIGVSTFEEEFGGEYLDLFPYFNRHPRTDRLVYQDKKRDRHAKTSKHQKD